MDLDTVTASDPAAKSKARVVVDKVDHFFGEGDCRNQVLFDNNIRINAGELVVMTGPSGSGKTTLLTLIDGLRSLQVGRIEILGRDLSSPRRRCRRNAPQRRLHLSDAQLVRFPDSV